MYNVVSTCAYGNTSDKVEQHNRWQDIAETLETNGLSETKIDYRPVHSSTLTNDVQYFPPKERVY